MFAAVPSPSAVPVIQEELPITPTWQINIYIFAAAEGKGGRGGEVARSSLVSVTEEGPDQIGGGR